MVHCEIGLSCLSNNNLTVHVVILSFLVHFEGYFVSTHYSTFGYKVIIHVAAVNGHDVMTTCTFFVVLQLTIYILKTVC